MLYSNDPITRSNMYKVETVNGVKELDYSKNKFADFDTKNYRFYTVSKYMKNRPDLIALETLGNEKYWWCILQFNNIMDPFNDIKEGMQLKIPIFTKEIDNHIRNSRKW